MECFELDFTKLFNVQTVKISCFSILNKTRKTKIFTSVSLVIQYIAYISSFAVLNGNYCYQLIPNKYCNKTK